MSIVYRVFETKGNDVKKLFDTLCEENKRTIATTSLVNEIACPVRKERLTAMDVKAVYDYLNSETIRNLVPLYNCYYCKAGLCGYAEYEMTFEYSGATDNHGYYVVSENGQSTVATKQEAFAIAEDIVLKYRIPVKILGRTHSQVVAQYYEKIVRESNRKFKTEKRYNKVLPVYRYFFCYTTTK